MSVGCFSFHLAYFIWHSHCPLTCIHSCSLFKNTFVYSGHYLVIHSTPSGLSFVFLMQPILGIWNSYILEGTSCLFSIYVLHASNMYIKRQKVNEMHRIHKVTSDTCSSLSSVYDCWFASSKFLGIPRRSTLCLICSWNASHHNEPFRCVFFLVAIIIITSIIRQDWKFSWIVRIQRKDKIMCETEARHLLLKVREDVWRSTTRHNRNLLFLSVKHELPFERRDRRNEIHDNTVLD